MAATAKQLAALKNQEPQGRKLRLLKKQLLRKLWLLKLNQLLRQRKPLK